MMSLWNLPTYFGIAQTRLDRVANIYINAAKKSKAQMVKAHNEAVGNVQAKLIQPTTAANRRQAVDSVVSADAPLEHYLQKNKCGLAYLLQTKERQIFTQRLNAEKLQKYQLTLSQLRYLAVNLQASYGKKIRNFASPDWRWNSKRCPSHGARGYKKNYSSRSTTQRMARGIMHT